MISVKNKHVNNAVEECYFKTAIIIQMCLKKSLIVLNNQPYMAHILSLMKSYVML